MAWGGQLGLTPLSSCRSGYCFCCWLPHSHVPTEDNVYTAALAGLISSDCLPKAVDDREEGVRSVADGMAMVTSSCPFPLQSVSRDKLLMLGACFPKLAAGTRIMHPSSLSRVKRCCFQYFMKLHGFDLQGCVQTSSSVFILLGAQGDWLPRITANLKWNWCFLTHKP